MRVRSDIGVQNVLKILFRADKGQSHKTSRSIIRGSFVAGTIVVQNPLQKSAKNLNEGSS